MVVFFDKLQIADANRQLADGLSKGLFTSFLEISNKEIEDAHSLSYVDNECVSFFLSDYTHRLIGPTYESYESSFGYFLELVRRYRFGNDPSQDPLLMVNKLAGWVFVSRDTFGVQPLFYCYLPQRFLVVTRDFSTFLKLDALVPYLRINKEYLAHYLSPESYSNSTASYLTVFDNIHSVLPGEVLSVSAEERRSVKGLEFDFAKWQGVSDPVEIARECRKIFLKSVENSVSKSVNYGANLSGGLDSSAVSSALRHIFVNKPIHTFYFRTDTELSDEFEYANLVADKIKSIHHEVLPAGDSLAALQELTQGLGYPPTILNDVLMYRNVLENASSVHCDVMLTGFGGDTFIGHGNEYLTRLFNTGAWTQLGNEFRNMISHRNFENLIPGWLGMPPDEKFKGLAITFFSKKIRRLVVEGKLRESLRLATVLNKQFSVDWNTIFKKIPSVVSTRLSLPGRYAIDSVSAMELEFASRRLKGTEGHFTYQSSNSNYDLNEYYLDNSIRAMEEMYHLGRTFDIKFMHPFINRELLELSVNVPDFIKFDSGRRRGYFRTAMTGILPEAVRNRTSKSYFGQYENEAVLKLYNAYRDGLHANSEIWNYVDRDKFNKVLLVLNSPEDSRKRSFRGFFLVSRTIRLALWLDWIKLR